MPTRQAFPTAVNVIVPRRRHYLVALAQPRLHGRYVLVPGSSRFMKLE
jgi:hypothetical protein